MERYQYQKGGRMVGLRGFSCNARDGWVSCIGAKGMG